jgi:hypothetical protein
VTAAQRFRRTEAWRVSPVKMMADAGFNPDPHQVELLLCSDPQVLVKWPRQSGKSQTCAVKVLHQICFDPGDVVILAGEKQAQAQEVYEKAMEMHSILSEIGDLPSIEMRTSEKAEFANKARILACPSSVPSIRGYAAKLALIDEAAFTGDDTLAKVAPMLAATAGRLICPSTPNGDRGWWRDAWKSDDTAWRRLTVSIHDLPRLSETEIARQRSLLTPNQFRQEFLLEFLDTDLQFYSTETIRAALCDEIVPLFERFAEAA